ncbi:hypothetical protein CEUSTIGMA_g6953.t1 [Chlamydomonas eustigma]|uniref:Translation initiation factor IF-2, chloroplastic n=1 Tax=Chlamydomonas eustigma TaxID=1157962 RepID=A0A250X9E7_9CHLO|nr:hypothetical protein CEUSTIGMA_g6953.t1 [Chlamydomonas eustigma]|eukprot:GAX79512.1 hypothetical protein CEUSTIGMA_g6953.t1 [Chlamydomonas eustigma]
MRIGSICSNGGVPMGHRRFDRVRVNSTNQTPLTPAAPRPPPGHESSNVAKPAQASSAVRPMVPPTPGPRSQDVGIPQPPAMSPLARPPTVNVPPPPPSSTVRSSLPPPPPMAKPPSFPSPPSRPPNALTHAPPPSNPYSHTQPPPALTGNAPPPQQQQMPQLMSRPGLAAPPTPPTPPPQRPSPSPFPTPQISRVAGPPAVPQNPAVISPGPPAVPQNPAVISPGPTAPTSTPPSPPPSLTRPQMPSMQRPAPPPVPMSRPMHAPFVNGTAPPPMMRPMMQPPGGNGIPSPAPLPELRRPEAPPMRVLESLMPPPGSNVTAPPPARLQVEVVDEGGDVLDEEDEEFLAKKPGKKIRKARAQKVTAEMRRKAALDRKLAREERAFGARKEREEIFEVGDEGLSLMELADKVQVEPSELVRTLFMKGITLSMNQVLDKNTCRLVAAEYDILVVDKEEAGVSAAARKTRTDLVTDEDIDDLVLRPPVVTVMGHVDHGKTSLLDYIRKARVAAGEAGGITQGIGAYNTNIQVDGEDKTICFLDTPGHEAFSAMRARGARVTDVAIIIVAADDGVQPQTREAVAHAQAAGVPLIVAINKVDKPDADVERVKQELLELNLVAEEWGGNTTMVPVSAKKGTGVQDLLQMVCWVAEEQQLMANPKKPAQGMVIEAYLDKKKGPVATLLVQAGTLRVGDIVSCGCSYGKVRSMSNDLGQAMATAGPSIAVQMGGLDSVPAAGEEFSVWSNESDAREAAEKFLDKQRMQRLSDMGGGSMVTLSSLASVDDSDTEALQRMNLIIKADTMGVVEAIRSALGALPQQSVTLRYLLTGAGDITVSDVDLAAASQALLVGFNLEASDTVQTHAKRLGVSIMTYKVIYDIVDDMKAAMEGKLRAVEEKVPLGKAEVKAVFGSGKKKVAGCMIVQGKVQKGAMVSVMRGKKVVYEGKMTSLRRVKDNVYEVSEGSDCGLGCDDFLAWAEGDKIECYVMVSKTRKLEDAKASTAVDVATLV